MNILNNATVRFVIFLTLQQAVRSYATYRSASRLGTEVQKHELRKDGYAYLKNMTEAIFESFNYGFNNIK